MKNTPSVVYEFGKFRLDAVERLLFDGTKIISLTPKAFEILLLLVENCGHALTKEEMLAKVWQDSFVEENNLAQNISILRRIIGDEAIETVPRRGYRFITQVNLLGEESPQPIIIHEKISAKIIIDDENDDLKAGIINAIHGLTHAQPAEFTPETKYAANGDVNIAYQVIGSGDIDIVFVMGWISHIEYFWKHPSFANFLNRLASFSRLIVFDKRGTGLSDRVPNNQLPTLEQRMEDVHTVMDAVNSEKAVLIGVSEGGPMCSLFAATYPDRTLALVMFGTYAKRIWEEDYPWAPTPEKHENFLNVIKQDWGKPVGIEIRAPSMVDDAAFRDWWATYLRMGASPSAAVALTKMNAEIDVRDVLPLIRVPSLVIHRKGDMCLKVEEGRFVAAKIPGCKYIELAGIDHLPFVGEQDEVLEEIENFLTGVRFQGEYDRVLATVLAIKIVNPKFYENRLGKFDWNDLIERSRDFVSRQIQLFKGREVSFDEHGILATFDGPARAIRCATAITDAAVRLGLRVKTGLHTGECDVLGDKVSGIAVNLAGQIADDAEFGEILASRTVKDLVAGSGLNFEESDLKTFADVQGTWRIFSVKR
jgi:pimeloyl-ACP methyl ester carboxylesterase/DNA-binding winged helix-turn-helix (wHTH) protein/class 3 adenylate cyclase